MGERPARLDTVTVPCGSCLGCRTDQARQWAIRISHEAITAQRAWFVTLTYSPENVPEHGSLDPRDPTLFLKRLRRRIGRRVSYYLCGEYGDRTQRPHYHAVLCGPAFLDRDLLTRRGGHPVWTSSTLDRAWGLGLTELTTFSWEAASYVAGYVTKKARVEPDPYQYTRVDPGTGELVELVPEFGRMSTRPALGRTFLERYWTDVYPRDYVVMNGVPMKPPRYYDRWMEDHHPEVMEEVRYQRFLDAERLDDPKLIAKEKIHRAKNRLYTSRGAI